MSTHRCIAGFCEWRGQTHAVSVAVTPRGPAYYPSNEIELGRAMVREVLSAADGREREEQTCQ